MDTEIIDSDEDIIKAYEVLEEITELREDVKNSLELKLRNNYDALIQILKQQNNNRNILKNIYLTNSELSEYIPKYRNFNQILDDTDLCSSPIFGTTHRQSLTTLILKEISSPNVVLSCENSQSHILFDSKEDEKLMKTLNKKNKEKDNILNNERKPTMPLAVLKMNDDDNRYFCSMFFHLLNGSYYYNEPAILASRDWKNGILNYHMNIDRELNFNTITKGPKEIPFTIEINWCFDFRPTNMLMEELELEVKFDSMDNTMLYEDRINISGFRWYVHVGLTEDIINNSYSSKEKNNSGKNDNNNKNNKNIYNTSDIKNYKLYKIVDADILHSDEYIKMYDKKEYNFKRKKLKKLKNRLCIRKSGEAHFNGIPVVDYDENKNNSFLWQKIQQNYKYSNIKKILNNDSDINQPTKKKFNRIDLSKSSYQQFGFVLKAIVVGKYLNEILTY